MRDMAGLDDGSPIFAQIAERLAERDRRRRARRGGTGALDQRPGGLPPDQSSHRSKGHQRADRRGTGREATGHRHVRGRRRPERLLAIAASGSPSVTSSPWWPKPAGSGSTPMHCSRWSGSPSHAQGGIRHDIDDPAVADRRYRDQVALDDVTLDIPAGIHLRPARPQRSRQEHADADHRRPGVRLGRHRPRLGSNPVENDEMLRRMVFVREDQAYPRHQGPARAAGGVVVLPELERRAGRGVARRLRPAARPAGQEALSRHAFGARHRDRTGGTGRDHPVRRALCRPRRGGPATFLRPASRGVRRAPAVRYCSRRISSTRWPTFSRGSS